MQSYIDLGLDLDVAFNGVEAGLLECWTRMSEGRIKVFKSCQNLIAEYRLYRRDEKGKVVKGFDHAMDAMRYLVMSGLERAKTNPGNAKPIERDMFSGSGGGSGWMGQRLAP